MRRFLGQRVHIVRQAAKREYSIVEYHQELLSYSLQQCSETGIETLIERRAMLPEAFSFLKVKLGSIPVIRKPVYRQERYDFLGMTKVAIIVF